MAANDIYSEIKNIEKQISDLKTERLRSLAKFKKELLASIATYDKIFAELDSGLNQDSKTNDFPTEDTTDTLVSIKSDGTTLVATFGYSFRNEWNTYEVTYPARYLMPNGQELMELDATVQKNLNEAERKAQEQAEAEQERAEFLRLQEKFGNITVP